MVVWGAEFPEAGSAPEGAVELPAMTVYGEAEHEGVRQDPFLPPVQSTEIFSGKKATVIDLDALPKVQANNYRQALIQTPGLLYSEETTPLVSLGYRGLGEPHRMQFLQVLKDGIPIHADQVGYPEAYYTPPLDVVDRLVFLRGGSSLMYGPQPAGALNYVTYMPRRDRELSGRSYQTFGSDGLFSSYNAVDGTSGRLGYLGYYNHRQSEGFRTANSDYRLDGGHFKMVLDADRPGRWVLAMDAYEEQHGEPGGLTAAAFEANPEKSTRLYDRFQLRRYVPSLTYSQDFGEDSLLEVKSWGGYYDRFSKRQNGGGFGLAPSGTAASSNSIERQEFYTVGTEARVRHDYALWGETSTLTAGVHFYHGDSPRTDQRGAAPDAEHGVVTSSSERTVNYGAVFAENRFQVGKWSLTPGVRLENISQDVRVVRPGTGGVAVSEKERTEFKPLVGLSTAYALPWSSEAYGSVAQGYRPTVFTESVVPGAGTVVGGDVDPTTSWTYEVGYRGQPRDWVSWDTSLFLADLDNKYGGTVTSGGRTELRSVGRTINYGWDLAMEVDLAGVWAASEGEVRVAADRTHRWILHGGLTLMEAGIHGGAQDGRTPQYAPARMVRGGLMYRWKERVKVAMLGTHLSEHYATDDENPTRRIPAYMTWDLTAEARVWREWVSVVGGINNLFDEEYYARVRGDGIDPAYGRNFYAGVQVEF
jgi:Fe(3+) dicitrate transport protein